MARIIGIVPGLVPTDVPPAKTKKPKSSAARAAATKVPSGAPVPDLPLGPAVCSICDGEMGIREMVQRQARGRTTWVLVGPEHAECSYCRTFFGMRLGPGVTSCRPGAARQVIQEAAELGHVMLLRQGIFAAKRGGMVAVDAGDVFKVHRAGGERTPGPCSRARTTELFTISILIADQELVQYPHEVSPIPYFKVMKLRAAGELNETYVSSGDNNGHFSPREDLRDQILATFGNLVGGQC